MVDERTPDEASTEDNSARPGPMAKVAVAREHILAARAKPARPVHGAPMQVSGVLREGLRAGSLLLTDERTGQRIIVRDVEDRGLATGQRVRLTGVLHAELSTVQQQGTPFQIREIERLEPR